VFFDISSDKPSDIWLASCLEHPGGGGRKILKMKYILGKQRVFCNIHNNNIIIIRGATALTNLGRLSSRRWQSFPTAPDGTAINFI
jgi:hypothetical protein